MYCPIAYNDDDKSKKDKQNNINFARLLLNLVKYENCKQKPLYSNNSPMSLTTTIVFA